MPPGNRSHAKDGQDAKERLRSLGTSKPDQWFTPEQIAEILQVSPRKVRQMCRSGVLEARKIGKDWRLPPGWDTRVGQAW